MENRNSFIEKTLWNQTQVKFDVFKHWALFQIQYVWTVQDHTRKDILSNKEARVAARSESDWIGLLEGVIEIDAERWRTTGGDNHTHYQFKAGWVAAALIRRARN